ncbi:hypothetical protein CRG98_031027 [Punica granatum]|uniref:Uncharacterized protein n=1 Tax=Punica granatum TaxID=22663 RepID=A0A2I0IX87_PUNGR|nr:hypothetical protein CRG98_031027 [Punica granatum]
MGCRWAGLMRGRTGPGWIPAESGWAAVGPGWATGLGHKAGPGRGRELDRGGSRAASVQVRGAVGVREDKRAESFRISAAQDSSCGSPFLGENRPNRTRAGGFLLCEPPRADCVLRVFVPKNRERGIACQEPLACRATLRVQRRRQARVAVGSSGHGIPAKRKKKKKEKNQTET